MIGMIVPPGEIKKMVEKTAYHVAQNGSEFEKALFEIELNKPEFSFLHKENPYRGYYDHMVAEYSKQMMGKEEEPVENNIEHVKEEVEKVEQAIEEIDEIDEQAEFLEKVFEEVKEPEPDKYSAEVPEKLTRSEIAMIQHTAQYVAINGKNFLIALSEREKNNPQYEFLRSSSENHEYFTKIVAAYTYIIELNQEELKRLQSYITSKDEILNECKQVYEYHRVKLEQNKGKKDSNENKKESNIEWNDFELVETIVFEDFRNTKAFSDEFKMSKPLFSNKNMEEKIISEPKKKELLQQCQVCKQKILASEITKHLKTCLGSNKNSNTQNGLSNSAGNEVDVSKNLESLSNRRPDIFGGEGQAIRKEEGKDENNDEKIMWDGQAPGMSRTSASIAMLQNQKNKQKEQQNNKK